MTLGIAWIRRTSNNYEELIVASDSRLSGGMRLDCVPKIMLFPDKSTILCFAGETDYAYPLMLQLSLSIQSYYPLLSRAKSIEHLKGFALRAFNGMADSVHDYANGMEVPSVEFILAGYCWYSKKFRLWKIHYDRHFRKFCFIPSNRPWLGIGPIVFAGDYAPKAKKRMWDMIRDGRIVVSKGFDMEPFVILRDLLREGNAEDSIGGPPQIAKVYPYMNSRPFRVYWPNKESMKTTLLGRELLPEEVHNEYWIIDPDSLESSHPFFGD